MSGRLFTRPDALRRTRYALSLSFCLLLACLAVNAPVGAQTDFQAWGHNAYGQLGDNLLIERATPVFINNIANSVAVAAGGGHSLALRADGTVLAWGRNSSGQLGNELFEVDEPYGRATPLTIFGLTGVIALACGQSHSMALMSDGIVLAWGLNENGQIGDGFDTDISSPDPVPDLTSVTAIAAGMAHSVALKSDGTVWTWGYKGPGNFAASADDIGYATRVPGPNGTGALSDVVAVAAGGFHSLALKSDGTVWAWGRNASGQLGDNTTLWRGAPTPVRGPGGVGYLSQIVAIAGGSDHSLALKSDGTVWAWGRNTMGQLGDGTDTDHITPAPVRGPNGEGLLTDVAAIAAGGFHNLALKSDGSVWAWGYTRYGQTGIGQSGDDLLGIPLYQTLPTQVSWVTNGVAISAGDFHSFAMTAPSARVSGAVTLEESVSPAQLLTIQLRPADGAPPIVRQMYLNTDGSFRLTNLPRQSYQARIKGAKWLARVVTIDAAGGDVSGITVTLRAGDANNDNSVDVLDLDLLIQAFDSVPGAQNWNEHADFNGDFSVDVLDLDLLIRNFDRVGDP